MREHAIFEVIGYVGSAFVLTSFLMASVVRLRVINSVGSWLYASLAEEGIRRVKVSVPTRGHEKYMLKMGFQRDGERYVKSLR